MESLCNIRGGGLQININKLKIEMKRTIIIILIITTVISCKKDDDIVKIVVELSELSGFRGDTLKINSTNFNSTNAEIIINAFDTVMTCEIIDVSSDYVLFKIPDSKLYVNDKIPQSLLFDGYIDTWLTVQYSDTKDVIDASTLKLLFNPQVNSVNLVDKINYGDTIVIHGQDLDIKSLDIVFNTLSAKILEQKAREVKAIIPDSCGNGYLTIVCSNNLWFEEKVLTQQVYDVNFIPNYKIPKKVVRTYDYKNYYDYDISFNSDYRLTECDLFTALGSEYKRWRKLFYYDNFQQLTCIKVVVENEIVQVDSFEYFNNDILKTSFDLQDYSRPSPFKTTEYKKDQFDRIISSTCVYHDTKFGIFKIMRELNFLSEMQCELTTIEFSGVDNNGVYETNKFESETIINFNSRNKLAPLQFKTYMDGLSIGSQNELEYIYFPGAIIYKQGNLSENKIDLYYDDGGNLVKEEYYYYNTDGERKLLKSLAWIY